MEYWKIWRGEICAAMGFEPALPDYDRVVRYTELTREPLAEQSFIYYDAQGAGVCRLDCHDNVWLGALVRGSTVPGDPEPFDKNPGDISKRAREREFYSSIGEALPPFPGLPWNFRLIFTDADYRPVTEFVFKGGTVASRDMVVCCGWLYRYGYEDGKRIFLDKDGNKTEGGLMRVFEWETPK